MEVRLVSEEKTIQKLRPQYTHLSFGQTRSFRSCWLQFSIFRKAISNCRNYEALLLFLFLCPKQTWETFNNLKMVLENKILKYSPTYVKNRAKISTFVGAVTISFCLSVCASPCKWNDRTLVMSYFIDLFIEIGEDDHRALKPPRINSVASSWRRKTRIRTLWVRSRGNKSRNDTFRIRC